MIRTRSNSPTDTAALAAAVAGLARPGDVIVLAGEMGAGKTAFAQGFGAALGVHQPITSPTFALLHTYSGQAMPVHHADVYRLETLHEVADLGLDELDDGVLLVEWGDVVAPALGEHLLIRLDHDAHDEQARDITISAIGAAWAQRWAALQGLVLR